MSAEQSEPFGPIGSTATAAAARRAARSAEYRAERDRLQEFEDVARLVIKFRVKHSLTQKELAARVGTSHSAISRIESGQHKTSVETLRRIAKALGVRLVVGFESGPADNPDRELVAI